MKNHLITKSIILFFGVLAPPVLRAQVNYDISGNIAYVTNSPAATGNIVITSTYNGHPVTSIGDDAFYGCMGITRVTIPDTVTSIGDHAFFDCASLTNVVIPNGVVSIAPFAFADCSGLTSVTIPNGVTSIGGDAFAACSSLNSIVLPSTLTTIQPPEAFGFCANLRSIVIPSGLTSLGQGTFSDCTNLTAVYFEGDAPSITFVWPPYDEVFYDVTNAIVYYLPGTTGWLPTFLGRPTSPWALAYPIILGRGANFGPQSGGFGFVISWATNGTVVVEVTANLDNAVWSPVSTNALVDGSSYFSDLDWTNHAHRFYRVGTP